MSQTQDKTRTAGAQMAEDGMPAGQAPTPSTRHQMTKTQALNDAFTNCLAAVEEQKAEIIKFLSPFDIDYDFFVAGLRIALMRAKEKDADLLLTVKPDTFIEAVFRCAKDGLTPDGVEAAIGHFKGVAQYMPMRAGFVKVLWRTGMIMEINDGVVTQAEYDQGRFDYEEGDEGYIKHKPALDRTDNDVTVAAYCIIKLVTGGTIREVVVKADLEKIAKMSKSPARGAWKFEMDRKAAIRRAMKKMPQQKALAQIIAHDDLNYDLKAVQGRGADGAPLERKGLFSGKVQRRGEPLPALQIRERAEDPEPKKEPAPKEDTLPVRDDTDVVGDDTSEPVKAAVTQIMEAEDRTALMMVTAGHRTDEALQAMSDEERTWYDESLAAKLASFMEPFRPRAIISSAEGEREWENPDEWKEALLTKMMSLKGDALAVFWKKNLTFVYEAGEAGLDEMAELILEAAKSYKLPTDVEVG